MSEAGKFWSALTLLTALLAILFIAQATTTQARGDRLPMPGDAKTIFDAQCAKCHGRDGRARTARGRRAHARDMTGASWQDEVTDERLFNSINKGRGKNMPAYGKKLSENEIDALVRYVRRLKR